MKKRSTLIFGLLAALLAFSMVLAGCKDPNNDSGETGIPADLQGTWTGTSVAANYTLVITETTAKLTGTNTAGTGNGTVYTLTSTDSDSALGMTKYYFGDGTANMISWFPATNKIMQVVGFGLTESTGIAGGLLSK